MNREWVLQNLRETIEHIQSVISAVEQGRDVAFEVYIESIYRDLNRAWNGRDVVSIREACQDDNLYRFPTDISFDD
jgi:hypothetical protein